jgi:hypothetical protein
VERRLRVLKSRVLRIIFGPKRDELTEECRKVHNDEFNDPKDFTNITVYQRLLFRYWYTAITPIQFSVLFLRVISNRTLTVYCKFVTGREPEYFTL